MTLRRLMLQDAYRYDYIRHIYISASAMCSYTNEYICIYIID